MIFRTIREDYDYRESRSDYIEIRIRVRRDGLEKAIQDLLSRS